MTQTRAALILILSFSSLGVAAVAQVAGGYGPISTADPMVILAARYALMSQNAQMSGKYTLKSINKAQSQVVAGVNYQVCITLRRDDTIRTAEAVVYHNLQRKWSVTRWTWNKCTIK